jgi:hypothetical protein
MVLLTMPPIRSFLRPVNSASRVKVTEVVPPASWSAYRPRGRTGPAVVWKAILELADAGNLYIRQLGPTAGLLASMPSSPEENCPRDVGIVPREPPDNRSVGIGCEACDRPVIGCSVLFIRERDARLLDGSTEMSVNYSLPCQLGVDGAADVEEYNPDGHGCRPSPDAGAGIVEFRRFQEVMVDLLPALFQVSEAGS